MLTFAGEFETARCGAWARLEAGAALVIVASAGAMRVTGAALRPATREL
ncbi:MAG: hypothetical protein HYZ75_19595 [Elusimicrobia bacterium]|nr:hypothetical protein [Elusimicrobiota bacterium]